MAHQSRGWAIYQSNAFALTNVDIKCSSQTAGNNGAALNPAPTSNNFWYGHHNDLRSVYGRDASTKYTDACVAFDPTGALFAIGSTFHDSEANLYTTFGLKTERFRISHIK